jgi:hypothetical protein
MIRLLGAVLLICHAFYASAAGLVAIVDRTSLSLGETIELTLETADTAEFGKPDLGPLHELFDVLGSRQVKGTRIAAGSVSASTRWMITLQPKRAGYVIIPPLSLGNASSEPITLHVQEADAAGKEALAPVFIDATLDQDAPYVQAQVVLTIRIFHSVSLYDDSNFTQLQMPEAHVEKLGDTRTYEQIIGGVRHGVIEVRYGIYPQRSGDLVIPSQEFSATLVDRSAPNQFMPFGPRPGKTLHVRSPDITLTVRPKPALYPADAPWLPARALTLTEVWSPEPTSVAVGDSMTRNLMLRAEGLSSAQLPTLPGLAIEGLRSYADQPRLANQSDDNGLVGSREESQALVPVRAGSFDIPVIEITWWNTRDDRLERTVLPARSLSVTAGSPTLDSAGIPVDVAPSASSTTSNRLWPWQLLSALLLCTTLLGFGLWWRARRLPAIITAPTLGPDNRSLLDDLRRACQANDTHATRHALDAWARQQPETLADMAARFEPLSEALNGLNGALYSELGHRWQGTGLWRAIRELPPRLPTELPGDDNSLPPLYPK